MRSRPYVRKLPSVDEMTAEPEPVRHITGARVLAKLADAVTTGHIFPTRSDQGRQPARPLPDRHGAQRRGLNSYGSRRGNHKVMIRLTFANGRLRIRLAPGLFHAVSTTPDLG
jgi:aconitate hydratase